MEFIIPTEDNGVPFKSVDEIIEGRSIQNEADRLLRATERSNQLQNTLIQRTRNCVNSQFEDNIPEHSCRTMTEVCEL